MTDISELFSRNPLDLTREDINTIIEKMRGSRHAFNLGNKSAGSTKPLTEKQKANLALAEKLKIDI